MDKIRTLSIAKQINQRITKGIKLDEIYLDVYKHQTPEYTLYFFEHLKEVLLAHRCKQFIRYSGMDFTRNTEYYD